MKNKMKKTILFMAMAAGLCVAGIDGFAKKSRVNNKSSDPVVFKSLIEFFTNTSPATDGCDTIYLEGSIDSYTGPGINRKVCIIGPGFNLMQNPITAINFLEATISSSDLSFSTGSAGSELIGVNMGTRAVRIGANSVTVRNCIFGNGGFIGLNEVMNATIIQNYFTNTSSNSALFKQGFSSSGIIFNNNIVVGGKMIIDQSTEFLECNNNVFVFPSNGINPALSLSAVSFKNNIIKPALATSIPAILINNGVADVNRVSHNIFPNGGSLSTTHNNIPLTFAQQNSEVFATANPTMDNQFNLKTGYANGNFGSNDTQRGIFGGPHPYVLSGVAVIPNIFGVLTNGEVSNQSVLQIKINTKVNPS